MTEPTPPAAPTPVPPALPAPAAPVDPAVPADPTVPTQVKKPWRATLRTAFAALVAVASMAPLVYAAAFQNEPEKATGWSALALGIAAGITRVLAVPAVEAFLQTYLPFLAADSKS